MYFLREYVENIHHQVNIGVDITVLIFQHRGIIHWLVTRISKLIEAALCLPAIHMHTSTYNRGEHTTNANTESRGKEFPATYISERRSKSTLHLNEIVRIRLITQFL